MTFLGTTDLDYKDYLIFRALQESPLSSPRELGERINMSAETVRIRLSKLKKNRFLRPNQTITVPLLGKREQTEVEAIYNPTVLGLTRVHAIFKNIPDQESMKKLTLFCEEHPYTHYRVQLYANGLSLYTQFDIPLEGVPILEKTFNDLKQAGLMEDVTILNANAHAYSKSNFSQWNIFQNVWELQNNGDVKHSNPIEEAWQTYLETSGPISYHPENPEIIHNFDETDMLLLRELTVNAKLKIKGLEKFYSKDPTTLSRRITRLKNTVVQSVKLFYDYRALGLEYSQLVVGEYKNNDAFNPATLYDFMKTGGLPFQGTSAINGKTFFWYLLLPASYAPSFSQFLWLHTKNMQVYQLNGLTSRTYYFYHENYLGQKTWNTDESYIRDIPLQALNLKK